MRSYRGKRLFDLAVVLLAAPLWLPVMLLVAFFAWMTQGRPILFTQDRVGFSGKLFRMRKFRTMRLRSPLNGHIDDASRVTPYGRGLRATSLDELPELLNVLAGDMSLVGPRPLLPEYLPRYSPRHRRRHLVRPGITGLAQVKGRNSLTWSEKFEFDIEYVERNSLMIDLWILLLTAKAVVSRDGVHASGDGIAQEFTGYD